MGEKKWSAKNEKAFLQISSNRERYKSSTIIKSFKSLSSKSNICFLGAVDRMERVLETELIDNTKPNECVLLRTEMTRLEILVDA